MKKTVLFITCSVLILLSVSCSIETAEPIASDTRRMKLEFDAEMTEVRTKTSINPDAANAVYWSKGDEINIFTENGSSDRFVLAGDGGSASGTFTGETVQSGTYYALYPYSSAATYSGNVIKANLPATQYCTSTGTFDTMLNPAVAVSDGDNSLSFKNVAGLLELTFTNMEGKSVKEISLKAAESLAGDYTVDMSGQNYAASAVPGEKSVGVNLVVKAEETRISDPVYYLVLLPGAYSNLSLTVIYDDYSYMSGKLDSFTVKAGELRPQKVDASKATANADGLYGLYQAGIDIEVGGVAINKETYGDAVHVNAEDSNVEISYSYAVYFLEKGAHLTWSQTKPLAADKTVTAIIVISDDADRSAVLEKNDKPIYFNSTSMTKTVLVMKNITYRNSAPLSAQNDHGAMTVIADNCLMELTKPIFEFDGKGKSVERFLIKNSTVNANGNITLFSNQPFGINGETEIEVDNNVFYSSKAERGELYMGNLGSYTLKSVSIANNIFMNLYLRGDACFVKADKINELEIRKNVFYDFSRNNANAAVVSVNSEPAGEDTIWNDNIFKSLGYNLRPVYVNGGEKQYEFIYNFNGDDTPFESIDPNTGTYVLKPEYASYGPQQNLK